MWETQGKGSAKAVNVNDGGPADETENIASRFDSGPRLLKVCSGPNGEATRGTGPVCGKKENGSTYAVRQCYKSSKISP